MGKYKIKSLSELMLQEDIEISSPIILDGEWTKYYVTSFGRVYRIKKHIINYIKPTKDEHGYLVIHLYFKNSKGCYQKASVMLNRLVAMAFIPNPENKPEVNHIDLNKENNHLWNLEWVTRSENVKHSYRNGSHKWGEKNTQSIYTEKQIRMVCEFLQANKLTKSKISELTGVAIYTIDAILFKNKWHHISSHYNINYSVKAENTGSTRKYNDSDIKEVCRLLSEKMYTCREISNITNVGLYTVTDIKRRRTWVNISKDYNF